MLFSTKSSRDVAGIAANPRIETIAGSEQETLRSDAKLNGLEEQKIECLPEKRTPPPPHQSNRPCNTETISQVADPIRRRRRLRVLALPAGEEHRAPRARPALAELRRSQMSRKCSNLLLQAILIADMQSTIVHKMPVCAQRYNIETSTKKDDLANLAFSERTTTVRAEEIQKRNAQASVT